MRKNEWEGETDEGENEEKKEREFHRFIHH